MFDLNMKIVSFFGDGLLIPIIYIILLVSILVIYRKRKSAALLFLSSLSYFLSIFLKAIFKHERPQTANINPMLPFDAYSFPSSHVVFFVAFWGFILYTLLKYKKINKFIRNIGVVISVYLIFFVGISRMYLGQHYFKDVVAGYLFGGIYLGFVLYLDKKINNFSTKNKK